MIEFSIPDFWQQSELNSILIYLIGKEPNCFHGDLKIGSVFGSFPCIWNSGRAEHGIYNKQQAIDVINFFNMNQIEIRHTFTNRFIKETDKYDHVCNQICEITSEIGKTYGIKNSCTIYHDWLAEYISKTYPDLKIVYSTTKELQTVEQINKYSEKNTVIPSYNVNHNIELLKQLKYPQNIELLCIETGCNPKCKYRIEHQDHVSSSILQINIPKECGHNFNEGMCPSKLNKNWYSSYNNPSIYISFEQMKNIYLPLKINKFKISGRGPQFSHTINDIESYINFFVKPEYKDYMRLEILHRLGNNSQHVAFGNLYK